jgi:putative FmdB family regulatory protein
MNWSDDSMPLYVYVCRTCENRFERLRSFAERLAPSACPECNSEAWFSLSLSTPNIVAHAGGDGCQSEASGASGGCCGDGSCGWN